MNNVYSIEIARIMKNIRIGESVSPLDFISTSETNTTLDLADEIMRVCRIRDYDTLEQLALKYNIDNYTLFREAFGKGSITLAEFAERIVTSTIQQLQIEQQSPFQIV